MKTKKAIKQPKKKIGRPKLAIIKTNVVHIRFTDAEINEIDRYIKKNKLKTRSEIIRFSVLSKVRQTDIFDNSID